MPVKIMAIINTSPDSFNGDGIGAENEEQLRERIQLAVQQGADILDIGGQSTRPGAEIIDAEEEVRRTVPIVKLAQSLCKLPISIDTFKPRVAQAALAAGATIINDIHGFDDPGMREVAAGSTADIVIMHSRGTPKTMSSLTEYQGGVVEEVEQTLAERAHELEQMGVDKRRIIIDPGIGFAKTAPQSFELTRRLSEFAALGYRVLYGASQKSFLGKALAENGQIAPPAERAIATAAVQTYAMLNGADIVRVHDVAGAVQTRTIVEAILAQREIMP